MQPLSLYQLGALLRETVELTFPDTLWVTGELSEARVASNGHFYGELIEKDSSGRSVVARARLNCWARQYNLLSLRFLHETGKGLTAGMNVLLKVQVTYHEAFGFSLNVQDIDAAYTLGGMAQRRREILERLEQDGILHDNQTLPLPRLIRRIAVVSASTAAGYGDFCRHLQQNPHGFRFGVRLFPAVMQGQHVEESVLAALQMIAEQSEEWDVVVVIRGGGAVADMADFDSYHLAACIAQFPLPVIVGIGHERDETVLDYVAHQKVKTPTAAADFIIDNQLQELLALSRLSQGIRDSVLSVLGAQRLSLQRIEHRLPLMVRSSLLGQRHRLALLRQGVAAGASDALRRSRSRLDRHADHIPLNARMAVQRCAHRVDILAQQIEQYNPERILRQGYSLTTLNGKRVTNASQVKAGDVLCTRLAKGAVVSVVAEEHSPKEQQTSSKKK